LLSNLGRTLDTKASRLDLSSVKGPFSYHMGRGPGHRSLSNKALQLGKGWQVPSVSNKQTTSNSNKPIPNEKPTRQPTWHKQQVLGPSGAEDRCQQY
jgi:hypothetical protein